MTVNPDDLLIFKMRGIQTEKKPAAKPGQMAPQQQVAKPGVAPAQAPKPAVKPVPAAQPKVEKVEPKEYVIPEELSLLGSEERKLRDVEERLREVEMLESKLGEATAIGPKPEEEKVVRAQSNMFSFLSGGLFVLNAVFFGYFIFPQSVFIVGYIYKIGLPSFFASLTPENTNSFLNLMFAVLGAIGGILMFLRLRINYMVTAIIGALMILSVSFEYLTTGTTYLLAVDIMAFISIGMLAYSRMTAVAVEEEERVEELPQNVAWPKIEAF